MKCSMSKICYIIGAGNGVMPFEKKEGDLVIAADGGYRALCTLGVKPDLVLGDFDSLSEEALPTGTTEIVRYPVRKDDTDTLLAVKTGFERGYTRFVIYGGTGGRLDHTLANLQTLSFIATNGGIGFLCGNDFTATALTNKSISFSEKAQGTISLFSATDKCEISLDGLLYSLNRATVTHDFPIGVSNEFVGEESKITAHSGTAIIIWSGGLEDCFYMP